MSGYSSNHPSNSLNTPFPGGSHYNPSSSPSNGSKYSPPKAVSCPGRPYCSVCPSRKEHVGSPNKMNSRKLPTSHCCSPKADDPSADNPDSPTKPACRGRPHCMLCMDRPTNPTFLDCLIEGIDYLDRSLNKDTYPGPDSNSKLPPTKPALKEVGQSGASSKVNLASSSSETSTNQNTSINSLQCLNGRSGNKNSLATPLPSKSGTPNLQDDPWMGASIQISHIPKIWETIQAGWAAKPDPKAALWW
ncbi:uncharacterized protein LOC110205962 [Phascolarctos cinereus]|uniref:Leucine-rich repeat extensin-like protein 5 n=1 Tax=Phascolarctos cinereus TaxID=38626 RepID=A0A6P5K104_PHACI|nr:leucine-rich repeat extensin-like protein 5 [Phascolarctos cinereus]XP_020838621.1 leucine-rich repeat extensin-like protein 5 [Phascolarctos cinereus]XP_020838622.1 leucine-rich repeat extensin-like protein 5 [Phascolarctos cinereus]XP_020838623.1 leucine-rich repeat extensin-like protein 5 [Phascolarctos cinereus]XP_020838625.1 leucine-rich repeat extensin-like protein 5 [Phascolarctos cinereus]XP_020838626.1 leucine-rich repeat extensin-like protein 5 [Phascolarctos cinereus]XP_02083862